MASTVALEATSAGGRAPTARRDPAYLISPAHDALLLIFSPLLALAAAAAVEGTWLTRERVPFLGIEELPVDLGIGLLIAAHLFISFFRSHGNPQVFRRHPIRFTVVPLALVSLLVASAWALAVAATVAVLWDVHHSGMQTFGLARMYDQKAGNPPAAGRILDLLLNHLLYAGPVVAGAGLLYHVHAFYSFEAVGDPFFTSLPAAARNARPWLALGVIGVGLPFLAYYLWAYRRLQRAGHAISPPKVALLASTGLCSVVSWGFNSFGVALFTMKLFHVVQYFALVGWVERENVARVLRLRPDRHPYLASMTLIAAVGLAYGCWAKLTVSLPERSHLALSLILSVTLLHFWYDGFMWSVRRREL